MNKLKKIRLKHGLKKECLAKWIEASVRTVDRLEAQESDNFGKYNAAINQAKFYYDHPNMQSHLQQVLGVPDGV